MKTVNGRNVVVQVDFSENDIDQCRARECSVAPFASASRSTISIAQLNPLSSTLMRWYGKLPSQNHQKPESTAPDD